MISVSIRNRVAALRELAAAGNLTRRHLELALTGFLEDADRVRLLERVPLSPIWRHARADRLEAIAGQLRHCRPYGCPLPPQEAALLAEVLGTLLDETEEAPSTGELLGVIPFPAGGRRETAN